MKFDDLYQEIILDHYRHPRNKANLDRIPEEDAYENPTCGDSLKLAVRLDVEGKIAEVLFDGHGCAISVASASIMTGIVTGLSVADAHLAVGKVTAALRSPEGEAALEEYGDLAALAGVAKFPLRVKCATLAWHALEKSI